MGPIQKIQYNEAALHSAAETFYALQKTFSEAAYDPNTSQADLTKLKGRFYAAWNDLKRQVIGNLNTIVEKHLLYMGNAAKPEEIAKIKKILDVTVEYRFEKEPRLEAGDREFTSDRIEFSAKTLTGTWMPLISFYAPTRFNEPGEGEEYRFGGIYFYATSEGFRRVILPNKGTEGEGGSEEGFRRVNLQELTPQKKK